MQNFSIEEQVQAMSFGNESNYSEIPGDISGAWKNTNGGYQSIDSKKLDQKLMIELSQKQPTLRHEPLPVYATVNINKKHKERLKKKYLKKTESAILENQSIYEEVGPAATACSNEDKDEANIYEPVSNMKVQDKKLTTEQLVQELFIKNSLNTMRSQRIRRMNFRLKSTEAIKNILSKNKKNIFCSNR